MSIPEPCTFVCMMDFFPFLLFEKFIYAYNVFWSDLSPITSSIISPMPPQDTVPFKVNVLFFKNPLSLLSAVYRHLGVGPPAGT